MSSQKNKQRILRILKYLYRYTDEEHPITNTDLVDMFTDVTAGGTRKTIRNDIDVLNSEGFNILETKRHRDKCYFPERPLDSSDVRLLINAIETSRFVSKEKANALKEKLLKFVSIHEAAAMNQYMYVPDAMKRDKGQPYKEIELITEAINKDRKIRYQSFDYLPTKEKRFKNDGEYISLSPAATICREDCYYVLGYSEDVLEQSVTMERIDHICNVEITNETAFKPEAYDIKEVIYKDAKIHEVEAVEVILECANEQIQNVMDYFGDEIEPYPASEGKFYRCGQGMVLHFMRGCLELLGKLGLLSRRLC